MRRRALLASVSTTLVSGCALPLDAPTESDLTGDTEVAASDHRECTPADAPDYYTEFCVGDRTAVVATRFDAGEATASIAFQSPATRESPAVVTVRLANPSDEPADVLHPDWWLRPPAAETNDTRLYLVPAAEHPLADGAPSLDRTAHGHWRATNGTIPDSPEDSDIDAASALDEDGALPPDESVVAPFLLVLGTDSEQFRPGRYRFGNPTVLSLDVWETSSPGPTVESRFSSPTLPSAVTDARWYHRADATTETYLEPSAELVTGGSVRFQLVNRSLDELSGNPYDWRLYRLVGSEWREHRPDVVKQGSVTLHPGGRYEWSFPVTDATSDDPPPLSAGRYAFVTDIERNGRRYATRFDVRSE